jgi:putative hemolysin
MNLRNLQELFIPVNKHGAQVTEAVRRINELYESDMQVCTFPAGLVSRRFNGHIMDMKWHKNFIRKAGSTRRDVVPVYFQGRNSDFFYRLASFRRALGIKANIEMFYLVNETFKQRDKKLKLYIGKPIPWTTFDRSKKPDEWAFWVKEKVYALGGQKAFF